ncbi:MAG: hypothetical protein CMK59_14620 [Proteobacteria bacterium]|nr:hypothetical protein [Pseudomonadota bacterium]
MIFLLACATSYVPPTKVTDSATDTLDDYYQLGGLLISPQELDFGGVPLLDTASSEILFINSSADPINVTSLYLEGDEQFELTSSLMSFDLDADSEEIVEVHFTPDAETNFEGILNILISTESEMGQISLFGTGGQAEPSAEPSSEDPIEGGLTISPLSYSFPGTIAGSSSIKSFQITNTSSDPVLISSVMSSVPTFGYSQGSPIKPGTTLQSGQQSELTITFAPELEQQYSGVITIQNNSENTPTLTINLDGEGTCDVCSPILTTNANSMTSFKATLFTSTVTQDIILSNTGDRDLEISSLDLINDSQAPASIQVPHPDFPLIQIENCGTDGVFNHNGISSPTLTPGMSTTLTVSYTYTGSGFNSDDWFGCAEPSGSNELTIYSNDTSQSAVSIPLEALVSLF